MAFNDPISYLYKQTWNFAKGARKKFVISQILFVISNIIQMIDPLILAAIINEIQINGLGPDNVVYLLILTSLFIGTEITNWLAHGNARVLERKTAFIVRANYKKYLLNGLLKLPIQWHNNHSSGDTIDKVTKGSESLYHFAGRTFIVLNTVLGFIFSLVALFYFNVYAGIAAIVTVIVIMGIIQFFDSTIVPQYKELNKQENKIASKIYDALSNVTTVIILRIEKLISKDIVKKMVKPYYLYSDNAKRNEYKWAAVSICAAIMMAAVIGSYIINSYLGNSIILIGTVSALYAYVNRIRGTFFSFTYNYGEIVRERTAVANAEEVSNQFKKVKKYKSVLENKKWNKINIDKLSFSYPMQDSSKKQVKHLEVSNIEFNKGGRIAFIGESGSGKTTMLKLVRGLYSCDELTLEVDGQKLDKGFKSLANSISLIPQDPEIFNSTIKENITMGIKHTTPYIDRFVKHSRFDKVLPRLPKGYQSEINEKGVNLSGGERQRLALARGLLASVDKEIILLDEPTSSVDPKNELAIYKTIFKNFKKQTIISSIHRLHLLPLFTQIYVFEKGKVVGKGSFKELQKDSKKFRAMWKKYQEAQKESKS